MRKLFDHINERYKVNCQLNIEYGKEHIIPLPFNKEALIWVASAVARTAFEEGVARVDSYDDAAYKEKLRCIIYGCPEEE